MNKVLGSFKARDGHVIKCIMYQPNLIKYLALGVHGGCFHDGDETWNSQMSHGLADKGVCIMQLNFRQNSTVQALMDLEDGCMYLINSKFEVPFGIIGGSSGAMCC